MKKDVTSIAANCKDQALSDASVVEENSVSLVDETAGRSLVDSDSETSAMVSADVRSLL